MRISDWSSDVCSSDLDQEAVEQEAPHAGLGEQFAVVVQRGRRRQQRRREVRGLAGLHERHRQHPKQRRQAEHGQRDQQAIDDGGGEGTVHSTPFRRANHNSPLVTATISTNSRKATAERSEEHTSELQSLMRISYAVFCLKKTNRNIHEAIKHLN